MKRALIQMDFILALFTMMLIVVMSLSYTLNQEYMTAFKVTHYNEIARRILYEAQLEGLISKIAFNPKESKYLREIIKICPKKYWCKVLLEVGSFQISVGDIKSRIYGNAKLKFWTNIGYGELTCWVGKVEYG